MKSSMEKPRFFDKCGTGAYSGPVHTRAFVTRADCFGNLATKGDVNEENLVMVFGRIIFSGERRVVARQV